MVSAFRSRQGASSRLLALTADRQIPASVTLALFLEYEEVLKRPEQRAVSTLSIAQIDGLLATLADAADTVNVRFSWRSQLTGSDDELVLDAALNGRADAIVTFNITDFARTTSRLGLPVLTATSFLRELEMGKPAIHSVQLPISISNAAEHLAEEDGVSLNDLIASAVAQKVGAVETAANFAQARG